jgi:hypothetical protein
VVTSSFRAGRWRRGRPPRQPREPKTSPLLYSGGAVVSMIGSRRGKSLTRSPGPPQAPRGPPAAAVGPASPRGSQCSTSFCHAAGRSTSWLRPATGRMNPTCPPNQCGEPCAVCGTAVDTDGWNGDTCWRLGRRWRRTLLPPPRWLPVASAAPPSLASPSLLRRYICPRCRQGSVAAWAWRRWLPVALPTPAHQDLAGATHGQPLLPSSRLALASSLLSDCRPPRAQGDWSPAAAWRARLVAARSSSMAPPPTDVRWWTQRVGAAAGLRARFGGGSRCPEIWRREASSGNLGSPLRATAAGEFFSKSHIFMSPGSFTVHCCR